MKYPRFGKGNFRNISLCAPVEDGYVFWEINDTEENRNLVAINKDFPNSEAVANELFERITPQEPENG